MVMCFAPDCKHYSERKICSFFRFPKDPALCRKWISLIRREDKGPTQTSLICSCHFVNGDKKNLPSLFEHNEKKLFTFPTPEMKKRRKLSDTKEIQEALALVTVTEDPNKEQSSGNALVSVDYSTPGPSKVSHDSRSSTDTQYKKKMQTLLGTASAKQKASFTVTGEEKHFTGNASVYVEYSTPGPSKGSDDSRSSTETSTETKYEKMQTLLRPASAQQEAEMYFLKKENEMLKKQLENLSNRFSFDVMKDNDKLVNMYTGLPTAYIFNCLYSLFENLKLNYTQGWSVGLIPKKDQLLLTLMKLRLNLLHNDLACRFNCSQATVSNIISTWIYAIHEIIFCQLMVSIPSRSKNKQCMPACFSTFTNCRIVLDCTEVKCIKPSSLVKQRSTYSSYKHQNTVKGLIGVAPNGVITFVSDLYPGSTSDKKIVQDCTILEKLVPGDLVLADKGFLIADILPEEVSLNLPPFLTTPQFTPQQIIQTRTIARARIHVERAIQRIKCFSILDSIPQSLMPYSTEIFQVCAALTNLQFPLIAEVGELYKID